MLCLHVVKKGCYSDVRSYCALVEGCVCVCLLGSVRGKPVNDQPWCDCCWACLLQLYAIHKFESCVLAAGLVCCSCMQFTSLNAGHIFCFCACHAGMRAISELSSPSSHTHTHTLCPVSHTHKDVLVFMHTCTFVEVRVLEGHVDVRAQGPICCACLKANLLCVLEGHVDVRV
jgi:hypothetical protein